MLTRNFYVLVNQFLNSNISNIRPNLKDTTGAIASQTGVGINGYSNIFKNGVYLRAGSGLTLATIEDYKIEEPLSGLSYAAQSTAYNSNINTNPGCSLSVVVYITNRNTFPVTITELVVQVSNSPNSTDSRWFILARENIEPITLQPFESQVFSMMI